MAKTYNVDIVGSLTNNDGVLSGFTANNYAKFNKPFTSEENKAIEIVVKFKLNSIPTDTEKVIFGGDTYPSVSLRIRSNKKLRVGVPSRDGQELYNTNGLDELLVNTTYYIKIVIPNTTANPSYVRFYLSTTPTFPSTPSDLGVNVPYVIQLPSEVRFGNNGGTTQPFDGEIDLNSCYIKENGTVVWEGVSETPTPSVPIPKIGSNDISKIYLGSEEISKIYLGSEVIYEASSPPVPTPIGAAYRNGVEYTGNDLSDTTYLLKADTSGQIPSFDMTKPFELLAKNVQWHSSSVTGVAHEFLTIKTGGGNSQTARFKISTSSGRSSIRAEIYNRDPVTIPVQPNTDYDYQIKYEYDNNNNVGTLSLNYKTSDSDTWLVGESANVILTVGTANNYILVGGTNSVISGTLDGVTFKNDGNILFQR